MDGPALVPLASQAGLRRLRRKADQNQQTNHHWQGSGHSTTTTHGDTYGVLNPIETCLMTSANTNAYPLTVLRVAEALVNVKRTSLWQVQLRYVGVTGVLSLHHASLL